MVNGADAAHDADTACSTCVGGGAVWTMAPGRWLGIPAKPTWDAVTGIEDVVTGNTVDVSGESKIAASRGTLGDGYDVMRVLKPPPPATPPLTLVLPT